MKRALTIFALAALCVAFSFAAGPQEKKAGPYDAYCGEYEFDMSAYGGDQLLVKVFVENGQLMVWGDRSEPAEACTPVEGNPTKFTLEDPDEGHWDIEFLKDEKGNFTKCHLVNPGLGIDVTGNKKQS